VQIGHAADHLRIVGAALGVRVADVGVAGALATRAYLDGDAG